MSYSLLLYRLHRHYFNVLQERLKSKRNLHWLKSFLPSATDYKSAQLMRRYKGEKETLINASTIKATYTEILNS
jgi:hypothetical protein